VQIALIGFQKSGKTTVFNALTGAGAEVSAFASGKAKTHRAVVTVPDDRLDRLQSLYQSKKLAHASVEYVDPVGIRRDQAGHGEGLGEEMLNAISNAEALVAVVRSFEDESAAACEPEADYEAIALELLLSDLAKADNRLGRIAPQIARMAVADRKGLEQERHLMERVKEALEAGRPVRALEFPADEEKVLRSFQFLTAKPLLVALNAGEDARDAEALAKRLGKRKAAAAHSAAAAPAGESGAAEALRTVRFFTIRGNTEMEIARLSAGERAEFLAAYGIDEPGSARMIRLTYETLGLISFFTIAPNEAHAWTIRRGARAVDAAGAVHSDMQRGFIRAQVVRWDDLLAAGSVGEARKRAQVRMEGRDYAVQDGDVIEILFSV
jgi:hypothetical protein